MESEQQIPRGLSTAVDKSLLARIGDAHLDIPDGFTVHPRVKPVLEKRREMAYEGKVDWAFAELLALGSLVAEGKLIRLSGQDSRRGTFTQRHSVIIDRKTGAEFTPLQLLATNKDGRTDRRQVHGLRLGAVRIRRGRLRIRLLGRQPRRSGVVGGAIRRLRQRRAVDHRRVHQLGRGQVGPAVRCRAAAAARSGGQGPDHTSGRIERFLLLWAEGSMTIAVPSTPANYFHLLRRHALDGIHRPLIVFTPKSMLRNKAAVSDIRDFTEQKFRSVLEEPTYTDGDGDRDKVKRILMTSGKIYYELVARKAKDNREDVAIVRIEQLAPLPKRRLSETLDRYPNAEQFFWVQEEPANQGAWPTFGLTLPELLPDKLTGLKRISRRAMSAPSSGSSKVHAVEQQEIIDEAFG